jgi:hypothetical protein
MDFINIKNIQKASKVTGYNTNLKITDFASYKEQASMKANKINKILFKMAKTF